MLLSRLHNNKIMGFFQSLPVEVNLQPIVSEDLVMNRPKYSTGKLVWEHHETEIQEQKAVAIDEGLETPLWRRQVMSEKAPSQQQMHSKQHKMV